MDRLLVILNPYAGRGAAGKARDRLAAALHRAGLTFDLVATAARMEAITLAAAARQSGYTTIVAAGGDGTVNEVVNGLAQVTPEGDVIGRLAMLPVGTGNDLADMLGLPHDFSAAAARIAAGQTRRIDVGCAVLTSPSTTLVRFFDNNLGLGFEAQVTQESYSIHRLAGTLRYVVAALRALRSYRLPFAEVSWEAVDGHWEERAQRTLLISLGNSRRTGGVFYLTPDAELDDGLFDLGVARALPRWRVPILMPKVLRGAHRDEPVIELTRCRRLRFTCAETMPVHLDGEVVMPDVQQAEVVIQPRRLEIVV
jgi:YegS/Rv2252/BmrU family lipid kinase